MFYNWFDHPLIEAWLERRLAASRLTTSHAEAAFMALDGVGDKSLGEWFTIGKGGVFHLRRRLSMEEQRLIGPAVDIRGTPESIGRMASVQQYLPSHLRGLAGC